MAKFDIEKNPEITDTTEANPIPTKPTKWQRFRTHMKRWWWIHVTAFCIAILVIILLLLFVGIPHFADEYIDNYHFDYTGLAITNPRPHSIHVSQKKKLTLGSGFSGSGYLTAFDAICQDAHTKDEFAVFPVPRIEFGHGQAFSIDQDLNITCVECLSKLAIETARTRSLAVLVTGTPDLEVRGLPTAHLNIHKTVNMNGYNITKFVNTQGAFNISSIELMDPPVDGFNFNATIVVRNPTAFTVQVGHATFNLTMGGADLGYVDLPNLMLEQSVFSTVVLGNIDINMLIHQAMWGDGEFGWVTIDVKGHSCDYKGQVIPYYDAAIKAVSVTANIDLMKYGSNLFG